MESSVLVSEYLLNRSSLETLISYDKFKAEIKKETNSKFSPRLLRLIYLELVAQRKEALQSIKDNIDKLFDIPIKPLVDLIDSGYRISSNSIQNLNQSLRKLEHEVEIEISPQSTYIQSVITSIERLLEKLNEYKPQELVKEEQINEVNKELDKLKSYFEINTEQRLAS